MRSIMSRASVQAKPAARPSRTAAPYSAAVFDVSDMESARSIILTPAPDISTNERWDLETKNTLTELGRVFSLDDRSIVLDYGCGAGRIAKALIDTYHCSVVGVDISLTMRELATSYVNSERFAVYSPKTLDQKIAAGFRATHACCCWVLQHCEAPEKDVARISAALLEKGPLFVLNSEYRWVPTETGWQSDGTSIEALLSSTFDVMRKIGTRHIVESTTIANQSYVLLAKKRATARHP